MKKFYSFSKYAAILLMFLCLGNVLKAQPEMDVTNKTWNWCWGGAAERVDNPLQNSANNNATVWQFTPSQLWGGFAYGDNNGLGIDFSKYSTFECLVYCPEATNPIKLLIAMEGDASAELDLGLVACKDDWALVTGSVATWNSAAAKKFAIKNGNNTTAGMKIYFDKIKFVDPNGIAEVIYDNAELISPAWNWTYGMTHAVVANPKKDAVNGTDKVREINAPSLWGALSQGYNETTIDAVINFSTYSQFEMLVYCPSLDSLHLLVGIDETTGFQIKEKCTEGWVKITEDIKSWAGNESKRINIKNGFGTPGKTIYIDEIKFVKPDPISGTNKIAEASNKVFFDGNNIVVESEADFSYVLYNCLGAYVAQGNSSGSRTLIEANKLTKGIYVLGMKVNGKLIAQKITVY